MLKGKKNLYSGMNIDELRNIVKGKYIGMTYKEIRFADIDLFYALKREVNDIPILQLFYDEGIIRRINRPVNYFKNLNAKEAIEIVRRDYRNFTMDEFSFRDSTFCHYIRTKRLNGKRLSEILIDEGTIKVGSKSHKKEGPSGSYHKWEKLKSGYRDYGEYMYDYARIERLKG